MREASGGRADRNYFHTLAENAVPTIGWLQTHGVEFITPMYYLSAGPARIQPVGGGGAIVEKLSKAAQRAGVKVLYESPVKQLIMAEGHRVSGVVVQCGDGATITLNADAVILAAGGFQGNPEMMRAHFGARRRDAAAHLVPAQRFDTGDGIRMATEQGASISGDWNGMHIEPIDPRSKHSAPVVLVYPYGIVVDQDGRRFFDEGSGLVHETWEAFRPRHPFCKTQAYCLRDPRLPACSISKASSARSGRTYRRIKPRLSKVLRRRSAFPPII